jgi:hypothetical protein
VTQSAALPGSRWSVGQVALQNEARHALPRTDYDAVEDSTRAVSRSLLEVLAPLSP